MFILGKNCKEYLLIFNSSFKSNSSKDPLTYSDNNNNNNKKYSKYNARYITGSGEILRFLRLRHTPPADDLKPRRINFLNNHGIIINDRYSASYYNFDPDENGNKINNKRLYSEYNYPNASIIYFNSMNFSLIVI